MAALPLEISVEDVRRMRDEGAPLRLVDVREPIEVSMAHIEGAELIPMGTIAQRLMDFEDRDEPQVFLCHHGVRSLHVAAWLRERGVESAQSVQGGIDAWSVRVDRAVPRY